MLNRIRRPVTTVGVGGTSILKLDSVKEVSNVTKTREIWPFIKFFFQGLESMYEVVRTMERSVCG
jgi:hypothetical protein